MEEEGGRRDGGRREERWREEGGGMEGWKERKEGREEEVKYIGWSTYTMMSTRVLRIKNFNIKVPTNVPCLEGTY